MDIKSDEAFLVHGGVLRKVFCWGSGVGGGSRYRDGLWSPDGGSRRRPVTLTGLEGHRCRWSAHADSPGSFRAVRCINYAAHACSSQPPLPFHTRYAYCNERVRYQRLPAEKRVWNADNWAEFLSHFIHCDGTTCERVLQAYSRAPDANSSCKQNKRPTLNHKETKP